MSVTGAGEGVEAAVEILRKVKRINVVGTSGTGKTTFSRELAAVLGLPCIEMDRLFWLPGWQEPREEDFLARLGRAVSADAWVLDGNYNRTAAVKWAGVECVVWLDYSFGRTLAQAVRRAFRRSLSREELWPGTGNRESLRKSFFSRDSIILWTLKSYGSNRARYREMMAARHAFPVLRIGSPAAAGSICRLLSSPSA